MKRAPTHCPTPTLGDLDNNLSPGVGDFAQKLIPDLIFPGETLGDTLDTSIIIEVLCMKEDN